MKLEEGCLSAKKIPGDKIAQSIVHNYITDFDSLESGPEAI